MEVTVIAPPAGGGSHDIAVTPPLVSYPYRQQIIVTGGGIAVQGGTSTPAMASSSDYVVMLHLKGAQAAAVYRTAAFSGAHTLRGVPFADVTLWYTGGRLPRQIDVDH